MWEWPTVSAIRIKGWNASLFPKLWLYGALILICPNSICFGICWYRSASLFASVICDCIFHNKRTCLIKNETAGIWIIVASFHRCVRQELQLATAFDVADFGRKVPKNAGIEMVWNGQIFVSTSEAWVFFLILHLIVLQYILILSKSTWEWCWQDCCFWKRKPCF